MLEVHLESTSNRVARCGDVSGNNAWEVAIRRYCTTLNNILMSSSTYKIELKYSSDVNSFATCTYNGKSGWAVARVTFTLVP